MADDIGELLARLIKRLGSAHELIDAARGDMLELVERMKDDHISEPAGMLASMEELLRVTKEWLERMAEGRGPEKRGDGSDGG